MTRLAGALLLAVFAAGCSHAPVQVEESAVAPRKASTRAGNDSGPGVPVYETKVVQSHTVEKGDTLYSIAFRYSMDFKVLAAINGIREPYTIYPGQVLTIKTRGRPVVPKPKPGQTAPADSVAAKTDAPPKPVPPPAEMKVARPVPPTPAAPVSPAAPAVAVVPTVQNVAPRAQPPSATRTVGGGTWRWPAGGKVVGTFNPDVTGPKGIAIGGENGAPVFAARDGRVVYTGSSLVGYGQLVIIKHDDVYLSAYAHNSKVLVKEGDAVKGGEQIAEMGSTGTERTQLHFEVRRNGDPVDPFSVLPAP